MAASVAERLYFRRRLVNGVALLLSGLAALAGLAILAWILWTTLSRGLPSLTLALFTQMTPAPGDPGGGMLNSFVGSAMICLLAIAIGTPVGIAAGTYLAEYANHRRIGTVIRFVNDILMSAPSIVLGMFVWTLLVDAFGYSGIAGSVALAFIALPVIVRTTDEMLRLVPAQMREAALSLGIPQWKVTTQVLYRAALPGIVTGVLLALARISGETAPLLFTAFGSQFWSTDMTGAMASVPATMNSFANIADEHLNGLAWAAAFCMTVFVLVLGLLARALLLRNKMSHD
jgi:phosphate transport system permease protein